jgi:hypothetical protein
MNINIPKLVSDLRDSTDEEVDDFFDKYLSIPPVVTRLLKMVPLFYRHSSSASPDPIGLRLSLDMSLVTGEPFDLNQCFVMLVAGKDGTLHMSETRERISMFVHKAESILALYRKDKDSEATRAKVLEDLKNNLPTLPPQVSSRVSLDPVAKLASPVLELRFKTLDAYKDFVQTFQSKRVIRYVNRKPNFGELVQ